MNDINRYSDQGSLCSWFSRSRAYHDVIWGAPLRAAQALCEVLSLCSQQCGLSWRVIWDKRRDYNEAFHSFDLQRVAAMDEASGRALVDSPLGVIHNCKSTSLDLLLTTHCSTW